MKKKIIGLSNFTQKIQIYNSGSLKLLLEQLHYQFLDLISP